jgi:hypothetical protein
MLDGETTITDLDNTEVNREFVRRFATRVLAEGTFVLCMSEGFKAGIHAGIYDLLRIADGMIVGCWNTISPIAPRSEWKNDNGKF